MARMTTWNDHLSWWAECQKRGASTFPSMSEGTPCQQNGFKGHRVQAIRNAYTDAAEIVGQIVDGEVQIFDAPRRVSLVF